MYHVRTGTSSPSFAADGQRVAGHPELLRSLHFPLRIILLATTLALVIPTVPAQVFSATASTPGPTPALVTVQATAKPKQVTIGDPIHYTVQVSAAPNAELVIPVLSGRLGDFTITDFGHLPTRKHNGRITITRWYTLTTFTTGDHLIPAPKVQYRTAGQGLQTVIGNEVFVGVTSLLAQDKHAKDIRDIKPPLQVPFDWRPYGIAVGALLGVALLGVGFFYLLNRPRRRRVIPPRPPHELALAALARLRARRLVEEGKSEEFYVALSAIVRRYLEDAFRLRAPEMTTEEFLTTASHDTRLSMPQRRLLGEFLLQADLVKFARHQPTLADSEGAYEAARRFIDETRPQHAAEPEAHHAAA